MMSFLERNSTTGNISVAVITQTIVGIGLISILLLNVYMKNEIVDNWTPYILVYLGWLIVISPIISKLKPVTSSSSTSEIKKFVTAREELVKAMKSAKDNPEDVMMHIRSAIELSIRERFGFKKIHPMLNFLEDAKKLDFPLPSYSLIYQYFSEGSNRLHAGTVNTAFEVSQITRTVAEFFDELDKIQITQEKIDEFKRKCRSVKSSIPLHTISLRKFIPRTGGSGDEVEKKRYLRDTIIASSINLKDIQKTTRGKRLSVNVRFYLFNHQQETGRSKKDLDNLLKIVCDVLPDYMDTAKKEQGLGLIESNEDELIFEIHGVKQLVSEESQEGLDIEISEWVE